MTLSKSEKKDSFLNNKIFLSLWGALFILLLIIFSTMFRVLFQIDDIEELLSYSPPAQTAINEFPQSINQSQVVYVPVYSHVYSTGGKPNLLEVTLSIRNTDLKNSIFLQSVIYYNTQGKKIQNYLDKPTEITSLATIEFLVEKHDIEGGSGANFIVEWMSENAVNDPIIEAVMVGGDATESLSFVRQGVIIDNL